MRETKTSIKTKHNKKRLIEALESSLGVVTTACKKAGVCRFTFYEYYNKDESFRESVDSIQDIALDFAESKLLENIKDKKETSIIFYLKTKGKNRGYIEKQEIDHTTKGDKISINIPSMTTDELIERAKAVSKLNDSNTSQE